MQQDQGGGGGGFGGSGSRGGVWQGKVRTTTQISRSINPATLPDTSCSMQQAGSGLSDPAGIEGKPESCTGRGAASTRIRRAPRDKRLRDGRSCSAGQGRQSKH